MDAAPISAIHRVLHRVTHRRPSPVVGGVVLGLIILLTTAARWLLNPYLGDQLPYFLYLPAIIFATAFFGFRTGMIITSLSLSVAVYLWLPRNWLTDLACWLTISILLVSTITLLQQMARKEQAAAAELGLKARELERQSDRLRESEARLALHSKQLESAVAERTAKLAETVSELESFSYTVSHDLRSPLRAMQGFAEILLMEQEGKLDDQSLFHLRQIEENAQRMDRLVRDVLAYHGVGKNSYETLAVDPDRVIKAVLAGNPDFAAASVDLVLPLHPVMGNAAGLAQALGQLLGNAVKFVQPGHPPAIRIWTEARGDRVRLNIADNGIGIAANAANHIFKPFHRAHEPGAFAGTGMGLAIAKRAIERQHGTIGVHSAEGRGSTFWIELPAPTTEKSVQTS